MHHTSQNGTGGGEGGWTKEANQSSLGKEGIGPQVDPPEA